VACTKSFAGRVPRTDYRLTAAGRRALERYLDHMEALIQAMRDR
jgi:DNA-binding PadR family transcriptional regulator